MLTLISVAIRSVTISGLNDGFAIARIFQFTLGISAYLYAMNRMSLKSIAVVVGSILVARLSNRAFVESAVMLTAFLVCVGSFRFPRLNQLLDVRPLQFLGRISYSLYLYHASIVGRASAVTLLLMKSVDFEILPIVGLTCGIAGSVLFSFAMFLVVEEPTMRLSRRIKLR